YWETDMRFFLIGFALAVTAPAAAQTFKCLDQAGKTTYSNTRCAELGLKDAGAVADRTNSAPAYRPSVPQSAPQPPAPAATPSNAGQAPGKSEDPERRCFTVKTAKGTVTRCGEKPEEAKSD